MLHESVLPLSSPLCEEKREPACDLWQGLSHGPAALQLRCSKEQRVSALHVMLPRWHLVFAKAGAAAEAQNQHCHPAAPPGNT